MIEAKQHLVIMADDSVKCSLCKSAAPHIKCYCTETPTSFCSSCAVVHFLADSELPHKPLPAEERRQKEVCEVCKIDTASVICTCMYPWISYCNDCAAVHISNDTTQITTHTLEPLYAKYYLQSSAQLPAYYERQQFVEELYSEVQKNPSTVDACISDVNKVAGELIMSIEGWRNNAVENLLKIKQTVLENVKICCAQLDAMRYDANINPRMRIDQLVELGTKDTLSKARVEVQMLQYSIQAAHVTEHLAQVFNYTENYLMLEGIDKLFFPVPRTNKLIAFDLPDETPREIGLETDGKFKSFASWCKLPSGHIMMTGGLAQKDGTHYSNEACLLDSVSKRVRTLPAMRKARCRHGSLYFKNFVYVFGGYCDEYLKSCELFSLKEQSWTALPDLKDARDCVTAAAWKERIYIVGYSSNKIEVLDVSTGNLFVMPVVMRMGIMNLLIPKHCALVGIENGEMTIVMESEVLKINIDSRVMKAQKLPSKLDKSWYSPCPSTTLKNGMVYFFTLEMELWKLHLPSNELKFVQSIKNEH